MTPITTIKRLLTSGAAVAVLGLPGAASAQLHRESAAPTLLLERRVYQGQFVEQYVMQVMALLRQADIDGDGLDSADIDFQRRERLAQDRAQNIAQVLRYDLDGDLIVTPAEVAKVSRPNRERGRTNELGRFDVDGDGRVTLKEVLEASSRISATNQLRRSNEVEALMELPEAADGRLTAGELEGAARRTFAKADLDGDGRISMDEFQQFRASLPPEPRQEPVYDVYCPMPTAKPDDLIVLYGSYEGTAPNTFQKPATGTATVRIEPGRQPIYLILPSYEAIRWTLTGATGRVRQVVITSHEQGAAQTPPGADGVPQSRIKVFGTEGCVRNFNKPESPEATAAKSAVALRFGRQADVVAGAYRTTEISLPSAAAPAKPAP